MALNGQNASVSCPTVAFYFYLFLFCKEMNAKNALIVWEVHVTILSSLASSFKNRLCSRNNGDLKIQKKKTKQNTSSSLINLFLENEMTS